MKKIILSLFLGFLAFVLGLVGVFMTMPQIAPERVEKAKAIADSLIMVDSLQHVSTPNRLKLASDALQAESEPPPTFEEQVLAALGLSEDSLKAILQRAQEVDILQDSLRYLHEQIQSLYQEKEKVRKEIEWLKKKWDLTEEEMKRAAELGNVLPKLDEKQLQQIVQNIDPKIFQQIYIQASNRNRLRLLKALPPEKARDFVENMVAFGAIIEKSQASPSVTR